MRTIKTRGSAPAPAVRRRLAWYATAAAMLALAGWLALEWRYAYRFDGFPSARNPSLRLALAEALGWRRFYSQLGQDKWVLGVVFPGVGDGWFVDVGAGDAVAGSNTMALEEAGWRGVCIDPFPTGDWSVRRATLLDEVVSSRAGERVSFRAAGTLGGIDRHLGLWREQTSEAPLVELQTTTLAEVLERVHAPPFLHYLSLDTEGSEYEVLLGFPFERHRVGALTVEHNGEQPKRDRIRQLLESHGYRLEREQVVEDWYVPDPEWNGGR